MSDFLTKLAAFHKQKDADPNAQPDAELSNMLAQVATTFNTVQATGKFTVRIPTKTPCIARDDAWFTARRDQFLKLGMELPGITDVGRAHLVDEAVRAYKAAVGTSLVEAQHGCCANKTCPKSQLIRDVIVFIRQCIREEEGQ